MCLGCSDEPTSVGLGLLSSQDLLRLDTANLTPKTSTSILRRINTGQSTNLLIGQDDGYMAKALLRFTSIPDSLKTASVLSANLILRQSYRFDKSKNSISFSVYKMIQGWTESGVTWDSVTTASYENISRGSFSGAVADSDSIVVALDTTLVMNWLQVAGTETIQGIILLPTGGGNTILGFHSFGSSGAPRLVVTYSKGGTHSTITFDVGQDAHVANVENLTTNPQLVYIQAGVAYRSVLTFDLQGLPLHSGIHRATLELTRDTLNSRLDSQTVDSLISFYLVTSDSVLGTSAVIGRRLDPNSNVYSITITSDVQRWINGRANVGLQIEALAETSNLGLFTFFSASADPTKRPRLKVLYSRLL